MNSQRTSALYVAIPNLLLLCIVLTLVPSAYNINITRNLSNPIFIEHRKSF